MRWPFGFVRPQFANRTLNQFDVRCGLVNPNAFGDAAAPASPELCQQSLACFDILLRLNLGCMHRHETGFSNGNSLCQGGTAALMAVKLIKACSAKV
jgi:hypothetical protein